MTYKGTQSKARTTRDLTDIYFVKDSDGKILTESVDTNTMRWLLPTASQCRI